MGCTWPENLFVDRQKAIHQELIHGRELANQLKTILGKPLGDDEYVVANDLVLKILTSFMDTISMVNCSPKDEGAAAFDFPVNTRVVGWDSGRNEDSGDSSKASSSSALNDRRGCYKRRKTSLTFTKLTPTLTDDGHAWRKYGQKDILNAKHPRNYFRCTHKFDQGCLATKQVQKTQDEPLMYRITYHGHHSCKNPFLKPPQINFDSTPPTHSSILLNFGSTNLNNKSIFSFIEHEHNPTLDHSHNQSSSSDHLTSSSLTAIRSSGPMSVFSPGSDHGDVISSGVYSNTTSTDNHSLEDMDVMEEFHEFVDALEFEF